MTPSIFSYERRDVMAEINRTDATRKILQMLLLGLAFLLALTLLTQKVSSYVDTQIAVAHAADPVYQFCHNGVVNHQIDPKSLAANYRELCSN